jgi:hypothetical protein
MVQIYLYISIFYKLHDENYNCGSDHIMSITNIDVVMGKKDERNTQLSQCSKLILQDFFRFVLLNRRSCFHLPALPIEREQSQQNEPNSQKGEELRKKRGYQPIDVTSQQEVFKQYILLLF